MKICENLNNITPYKAGKPIEELERELGLKKIIKLASNENPLGVSKKAKKAIKNSLNNINRYPDSFGFELKKALAANLKIKIDNITIANGSNEVLELIARAFVCSKLDEVIFSEYAFVVYSLVTKAIGAKEVIIKSNNYAHDLMAMLDAVNDNTKIIFIANPNNPTGTFIEDGDILNFLIKAPKDVIVVIDQAYFEYTDSKITANYIDKFENLILTRTFSKAYGLAGLRVGYAIASNKITDYLNRIREPFNVNSIAQIAAINTLADKGFLKKSIKINALGLKQLSQGFDDLGLFYIASKANFISVKVDSAMDVFNKLLKKGVIVRPVEMKNFLRISVGTQDENDYFLAKLKEVLLKNNHTYSG